MSSSRFLRRGTKRAEMKRASDRRRLLRVISGEMRRRYARPIGSYRQQHTPRASCTNIAANLACAGRRCQLGGCRPSYRTERLIEIRDDVLDVFDPDGEPDHVVGDAAQDLLFHRELL